MWGHDLTWDEARLLEPLAAARLKQGWPSGSMTRLGFDLKPEAQLVALTEDVFKNSEMEGEILAGGAERLFGWRAALFPTG